MIDALIVARDEAGRMQHIDAHVTESVAPGRMFVVDSPGSREFIAMHPLDLIALQHHRNPAARLDAAMLWILNDTHRKLDGIAADLDVDTQQEAEHDFADYPRRHLVGCSRCGVFPGDVESDCWEGAR